MRNAVLQNYYDFTARFEGVVPFMYLDVKGLVTVGAGDLIDVADDPRAGLRMALGLPWMRADGAAAAPAEIVAEWEKVKAHREMAPLGGLAFRGITTLHLEPTAIARLVLGKLTQNETWLAGRFAGYASWPADGQLAIHSMAWAVGPAFRFPMFEAAVRRLDFMTAASECHIDELGNPGVAARNIANRSLWLNAATVRRLGLDADILYYPDTPAEPPTSPEGHAA